MRSSIEVVLKANLKMLKVNEIDARNTYHVCITLPPSVCVCFLRLVFVLAYFM